MSSGQGFDEKSAEVRKLRAQLRRREEENVGLAKKLDSLEEENKEIRDECRSLKETLNRAKDIRPWARPNERNVKQMARAALLEVVKAPGGWVVKMGNSIGKKFKRLRDIWLILTREEWNLHDEFLPRVPTPPSTSPLPPSTSPLPPSTSPLPTPLPHTRTSKEIAEIEVLRAEWRLFPSMRPAIEEAMARFGIALNAT